MNNLPGSPDRLNTRLDEFDQRICALEQRIALLEHAEKTMAPAATPSAPSPLLPSLPHWQAGGTFPVLGTAMLGIAGAYLLRALAETRVLPAAALEFVAVAYESAWLAAGARSRATFAATVYTCTSVLILAPMLWELTMRFKMMPAGADALTLVAFVVVAFVLARGAARTPVLRIANISAAALCLALAVATHANLPFLAVLLSTAELCEFAQDQGKNARPLIALAADAGVWMLIFIYRAPQSTRADYPALNAAWLVAPGFLLFAIFALGVALRSAWHRQRISVFDTVQVTIAFLLAACGLLCFGPATKEMILGLICLALAAALHVAEFAFLRAQDRRSQIVFGAWSVTLILSGIWFAAPAGAQILCLAISAIAATVAAAWLRRAALAWHATVLLLAAGWFSGLLAYAFHALAGTPAAAPSTNVWLTVICAVVCYGLVQLRPKALCEEQPFPFLFAAMAAVAAAALLVQGCARLAATAFQVGPHHLALIRSLILCAAALALAFSGARWRRAELTQIGYAVLVLEAVKLVVEDLRHGHLAYVAASVCLFAFTLIAIPRVAHARRREKPS